MLFIKNQDTIKAIEPILSTQYNKMLKNMYRSNLRLKYLKKGKIHYFFFFQKYQWFYPSIPEEYSLHETFQC